MFVEAAGAVLVCGSLACAASAVLRRRIRLAAALFAAALACRRGRAFGAGAALHVVACGARRSPARWRWSSARLGRPLPLTWLDFVMGGCAVGALAVTTGAELPATLGARRASPRRSGSRAGA